MTFYSREPEIFVGLLENISQADFELTGIFRHSDKEMIPGKYSVRIINDRILLAGQGGKESACTDELLFEPAADDQASFIIDNIRIGIDFHWEQQRRQEFRGSLIIKKTGPETFTLVNRILLEHYLEAVICSEMSPESPVEFLKAHCIISRSWLLAQLEKKKSAFKQETTVSWTDVRKHTDFDVCADDHCQRYHGIGTVNRAAQKALRETRGDVLMSNGEICDTRFSKCCGGITEKFSACWEDRDFDYLVPVSDDPGNRLTAPFDSEADVQAFIESDPDAFCNVKDKHLLSRILPDFDFDTEQFFRWQIDYPQKELQKILFNKTGHDLGNIVRMVPVSRGSSGRIIKLKIVGDQKEITLGKELVIRKSLSETHLYSSAFTVIPYGENSTFPDGFILKGAGWGHGVGLCQIGAAAMAEKGYDCPSILYHYFKHTAINKIY